MHARARAVREGPPPRAKQKKKTLPLPENFDQAKSERQRKRPPPPHTLQKRVVLETLAVRELSRMNL